LEFNETFSDSLVTNTNVHLFYILYPNGFWGFPYQTMDFGTPANKTDRHDIAEILLKVA
jgi:hypothetical protein